MAVLAVQQIRRMRGGAQGHLMLGADGNVYVVKFQNNPQHIRVLANEFLTSRLAHAAGLSAPEVDLVEVSQWLIAHTPELEMDLGETRERCSAGLQFGSRFVGGLMPGQVVDYLPEEKLLEVRNLEEFAGVLALDKWTGNANGRQAVFVRKQRERRYRAVFIDFGYCFHAGEWIFEDAPLRGIYYRNLVYQHITGWGSFEPWLTRLEKMPEDRVWDAANEVPPEWYGGDLSEMEALVEKLLRRRGRIRENIEMFRKSDRNPFPKWGVKEMETGGARWKEDRRGGSIIGSAM
ncbi:HipA family kinase [Telmatobacter bradus]|uniref:HipA family kinase n=1 Tax=Telmatobacter bradus TaxID=474953 RepID=UPI003B430DE3